MREAAEAAETDEFNSQIKAASGAAGTYIKTLWGIRERWADY